MRTALIALAIFAFGLLAVAAIVDWRVEVPPVGPSVEQICADTMQRTSPDLSWVAQDREAKVRGREIKTVTLGELPSHSGILVRVAGVLHAEFEWVGLYSSRAAMEDQSWRAPWVPPPPPPTAPPCSEKPTTPKPKANAGAGQEMLTEFNKLFETGEFLLGFCLADVQVNEEGTVDTVRVVRPQNVDKRVESAIVRSMKPRRYSPATACGRPVPFRMSVGIYHCPSQAERGRKPDR